MNNQPIHFNSRTVRGWVGALGLAGLMGTAAWYGLEATAGAASPSAVATTTPVTHALAAGRDSYADVVDIVSPAVVTVRVTGRARVTDTQFRVPDDDFFNQFFGSRAPQGRRMPAPKQHALGSGVVVTSDGYILTNNHVVDGADEVNVEFSDGRMLDAKIVGTDKPSDLALLKVTGTNLHALTLGNSDTVKVGDVVLAVGNPLNVGQTVTMGIISAKGRSTGAGDGSYEDFLQTDAPINHGNSGGALVNMKGELIGINSQILSEGSEGNIGIGFAIPANMARRVMTDLKTTGKVTRSQLGVTVQPVSPDLAESLGLKEAKGVIVSAIADGSAAEHAGLKRGDVITALNGQQVRDINTLRNRVSEIAPGTSADLAIVRDGAEKHVSVRLEAVDGARARRDEGQDRGERNGEPDRAALGISVAPVTPDVARQLKLSKGVQGLVVEDVDPEGRAADAGLQAGDVIQEVNRTAVNSVDDLRNAVRKNTERPVLLLVHRQGADLFMTVKPAA